MNKKAIFGPMRMGRHLTKSRQEVNRGMKYVNLLCIMALTLLFFVPADTAAEEEGNNPMVEMDTNLGSITIELYPDKAPISVKNFLEYVNKKFYDGTIFHRVMSNFMIQGGGFTPDMMKKATGAPIKNEANNGLSNVKGTIAMARTGEINSATCQFFINVKDNAGLDYRGDSPKEYGYAVFGKVIEGMDTVEKIRNVKTTTKGAYQNVPVKPVVIKSVRRIATAEQEEE
jgi:cyclophilin family peptidyl-prolyl cis-trans isomerase